VHVNTIKEKGDSILLILLFLTFVIPWFIVVVLLKIDKKIVLLISPTAALSALLINNWTTAYHFATIYPFDMDTNLASMPMILGIVPTFSVTMIWILQKTRFQLTTLALFTLFSTSLEWVILSLGIIKYYNGWNIGWTAVEYALGYILVYIYFRILKKIIQLP